MHYKELFQAYKKYPLRYISTGWSRVYPWGATYETPAQLTKTKALHEAGIILEFGDQLDKILNLTCKCLISGDNALYRFKISEITSRDELEPATTSFETGELAIQTVEIFEPVNGLPALNEYKSLDTIEEELYFGNALLFTFSNGAQLEFYGTESDDQYEPGIFFNFIPAAEKERFTLKRAENWRLKEEI